jgi:glycosyltransferase involved in cell wall biosynthesis
MQQKIKLLIVTDSAKIHTGLAETSRLVYKRLLEKYPNHYHIEQLGWFHQPDGPEDIPWTIHQTNVIKHKDRPPELDNTDRYGQRTFEHIRAQFQPDIVWTNGDLWCFDHMLNSPTRNTFRLCCYYTIDGSPYFGSHIVSGKESEWGSKLARTDRLAVLTEWGVDTLKNSCPEIKDKHIDVVYHPVDLNRFKPFTKEEKENFRKVKYPPQIPRDAFVLGWIGRNQFRKMNFKMWQVMHYLKFGDYIECSDCGKITHKEIDQALSVSRSDWSSKDLPLRASNSLMTYDKGYDYEYCWHCNSKNIVNGTPIDDIYLWMNMNKEDPGFKPNSMTEIYHVSDRIIYTEGLQNSRGLPPAELAKLISSWDGMLYLSGGEGFGVPAFEALMSGIPVIYTNYSSHADFCKHGGLPVRVNFIPELGLSIQRSIADTDHAIQQCLVAYRNRTDFAELGAKGRAFTETKDLDTIVDQWHTIFQEMMQKPTQTVSGEHIYASTI